MGYHQTSHQLAVNPAASKSYILRLYPLTIERAALLSQLDYEEDHELESIRLGYTEETEQVEEEWRKGRERVRERLLEGIEDRRRRAREEKDGEGIVGKWPIVLLAMSSRADPTL